MAGQIETSGERTPQMKAGPGLLQARSRQLMTASFGKKMASLWSNTHWLLMHCPKCKTRLDNQCFHLMRPKAPFRGLDRQMIKSAAKFTLAWKRKTSGIAVIKRKFNFSWSQLMFDPSLSIALRVVRKLWLSLRCSNLWTSHCLELSFSITPQYQKPHFIREKHKSPSESRLPYSSAASFVLQPCRERLYLFSLFIYLLCLLETKAYSHHFIFVWK